MVSAFGTCLRSATSSYDTRRLNYVWSDSIISLHWYFQSIFAYGPTVLGWWQIIVPLTHLQIVHLIVFTTMTLNYLDRPSRRMCMAAHSMLHPLPCTWQEGQPWNLAQVAMMRVHDRIQYFSLRRQCPTRGWAWEYRQHSMMTVCGQLHSVEQKQPSLAQRLCSRERNEAAHYLRAKKWIWWTSRGAFYITDKNKNLF